MSAEVVELVLPYPPSANALKAIVRGRMVKTRAARDYFVAVDVSARSQGARRLDGPVSVIVKAYRPRRSGDLDNALKAALDALKGIAYSDDSQVVEIVAVRRDDRANPRLVVSVMEVTE